MAFDGAVRLGLSAPYTICGGGEEFRVAVLSSERKARLPPYPLVSLQEHRGQSPFPIPHFPLRRSVAGGAITKPLREGFDFRNSLLVSRTLRNRAASDAPTEKFGTKKGSSRVSGKSGFDLQEEVVVIPVSIS
ncbi:hypothetical protein, partial [uncultured Alcanivorax sp.]|uniref:hypothetical protein n=2 Tax=uncultured Alcanivorax sp. TaxID=191215 RepID=UPI002636E086